MEKRYVKLKKKQGVSIEIYEGEGVIFNGGSNRFGLPSGAGGVKKSISGWSSKSRRSMREFLVGHTFPPGWVCCGGSFTVPGDDVENVKLHFKKVIHQFGQFIDRTLKGGMVWRLELQVRKMPHLHTLMILPSDFPLIFQGVPYDTLYRFFRAVWFHYIDTVLPFSDDLIEEHEGQKLYKTEKETFGFYKGWYKVTVMGGAFTYNRDPVFLRHNVSGWAWKYCVDIKTDGGSGAWKRYLQDHATKAKQDQVAVNMGRHWGVVGRDKFIIKEKKVENLSDQNMRKLSGIKAGWLHLILKIIVLCLVIGWDIVLIGGVWVVVVLYLLLIRKL